jgi:hypothetical protein
MQPSTTLFRAAAIAAVAFASPAMAHTCNVQFDQNLNIITNVAKDTFANPTRLVSGSYVGCASPLPNTDTGTCWDYRQGCEAGNTFTFFPQYYGHFHAVFDDPTISCLDLSTGGFGRLVSGVCQPANWVAEGRYAMSHVNDEWMELAHKNGTTYSSFILNAIAVGSEPIQLWYKKTDGSVWGWSNLGANTYWGTDTGPIVAVWISGADGSGAFTIYDYNVSTH